MLTPRIPFAFDFRRAALPLVLSAAALATGCTTTSGIRLDPDSCEANEFSDTVIGQSTFKTDRMKAISPDSKITLSYNKALGADAACLQAQTAVRVGLVRDPETGKFSIPALRALWTYFNAPDTDEGTRRHIKLRMEKLHGFGPEEILKVAQSQIERDRNPEGPENTFFVCRTDAAGSRRCRDESLQKLVPTGPAPAAGK